jgi:septum formation protein
MELILASQSPYRKAQLENFGVKFTAVSPLADEEELKRKGPADPIELTRHLAFQKAASLRERFPEAVILGADQMVEFAGRKLNKPGTRAAAKAQLTELSGHAHRLITSLSVLAPSASYTFTDVTTVHLRALRPQEIDAYLDLDQPFDCAGSYKIEKAGMALIERLDTQDPSAIQGLPLISLTTALKNLDHSWTQIWSKK